MLSICSQMEKLVHWMSFLSNYFGHITLEYSDLTEIIYVKSAGIY